MNNDFHNDAVQLIQQTQRDVKAWMGALQFVVYSRPKRTGVLQAHQDEEEQEKPRNHVSLSPDVWYESVKNTIEGALKNAEACLENEWLKRKDPRHSSDDSKDAFAHQFEDNLARIIVPILEVATAIDNKMVPANRQVAQAYTAVQQDMRKMVALYTDHCYEMTFSERTDSLLSLRARVVDGDSKAL